MQAIMTSEIAASDSISSAAYLGKQRREDVPALTGLRFIAAFSVLLGHGLSWVLESSDVPSGILYWLSQASGFGMTLFFVLSGFVIHYNYSSLVTEGGLRGIGAYLWARFARLYPLFLLMMFIYVLVSRRNFELWTGHPEQFDSTLQALPYFLLSIHSWVYTVIDGNSLLSAIGGGSPPTWSISTEWFFYFAYLCIAWLILRSRAPLITFISALIWCAVWIAISTSLYNRMPQINAWAAAHFGPVADINEHQQDSFVRWLLYFSPYLRIGEFVLGAIIAQLFVQLRTRAVGAWENLAGTAAFFAAAATVILITYLAYSQDVGVNIFRQMNMNFALAPSAALLVFCAARYRNVASWLLTSSPAIALGEASYSIYLIHSVVLVAAVRLTGSAAHGIVYDVVKLLLLITAVLVISMMLYAYYEAPARKWLRQLWGKGRSSAVLADAPQSSTS
jgi:peptidoglycan/LPS O-acetylase OafA/YrhL